MINVNEIKMVSIICVNFNQALVTEALLESIFETNTHNNVEVIVVDNGSLENPVPEWIERFPGIIFIRSELNLGFAGGNNIGISKSQGDFIFLVNNDTEFTAGLIKELLSTFQEFPDTGVVCPQINYHDQKNLIQYLGYTNLHPITARNTCIGQYEEDSARHDGKIYTTAFAHGAAMMISRKVIEKVGLMDETFFLYFEEFDWCLRIRNADFKIRVNSKALIYHKESISVGSDSALKNYYMIRNRILLMRRYAGTFNFFLFSVYFFTLVFPRNIIQYIAKGRLDKLSAMFRAIVWNFRNSSKLPIPQP